ncbi:hypothetical protein IV203_018241 [Nitzschia inconspicua]|uniref:Uncharacterized protein n=1 Tax=Nitzschia inconspicua TaxID=303405 RepID=A0A9K3M0Q1_9STRA|nr:hypothetical protein IV203_018241 [Nitzschia inconspicua]
MNFVRSHITGQGATDPSLAKSHNNSGSKPEKNLIIHPGLVEEAVHRIVYQGEIDLSELRFQVGETSGKDSVLDIAIFPIPAHCNSQTCDLSQYGVGTVTQYNGVGYLSLCGNDGRLQIHHDVFRGHHLELPIPGQGDIPHDRIFDGKEILVFEKDMTYEVMLANCNKGGRDISLSGQVVFESFGRSSLHAQDDVLEVHLLLMGAAVFLFFSVCFIRVHMGTRADYTYSRLLPIFRQTS